VLFRSVAFSKATSTAHKQEIQGTPIIFMKNENQPDVSKFVDFAVVDRDGTPVGTLDCLWSDPTGQVAFLGVKTGWFMGKTHVVPAQRAEVNTAAQAIRLPYDAQKIKDAPAYQGEAKLDERTEREVASYYNLGSQQPAPERAPQRAAVERASQRPEQEETRLQLTEEELKVGKRHVEYGGVRLRKIVRTETVTQPIELLREEIVIERVPADEPCRPGEKAFQQEEIYIPLRREEAVVQKEGHVTEEVRARKQTHTERQTISEQVRREEIQVEGDRERPDRRAGRPAPRAEVGNRTGNTAVFAMVKDQSHAGQIVDQLKSAGFSRDDISVLLSDKRSSQEFAHQKNTKAPEGATTGAAAGGVLGGTLGWLAGIGALAIPGAGPFIAAGPIMAGLSGAGIGAATGGLAGGLIGLGMPEYEARRYQERLKEGNVLISVHSDNEGETRRAKEIFERNGAEDIATSRDEAVAHQS